MQIAEVCSMEESRGCPPVVRVAGNLLPPLPLLSCFGVYIKLIYPWLRLFDNRTDGEMLYLIECVSQMMPWSFFLESQRIFLYRGIYITKICWKMCIQEQLCTTYIVHVLHPVRSSCRKTSPQRSFHFQLVHWASPHMQGIFELVSSLSGVGSLTKWIVSQMLVFSLSLRVISYYAKRHKSANIFVNKNTNSIFFRFFQTIPYTL